MNSKTQVAEAPAELAGTQLITLDPEKYVAAVFAPFRERLDAAKAGAKDIKAEVGTKEGMLVAIKQRALFRSLRLDIEGARKLRKAPILEISKKLDGRAHELTDECTPDEERFDSAIKAEEGRKERERAEREAKELARVTEIERRIAEIASIPGQYVGKPSDQIDPNIANAHMPATWAEEFQARAESTILHAFQTLQQLRDGAKANEEAAAAEAERIKAERAELARLRAEQEERARTEQARAAEEARQWAETNAKAKAAIEAAERASRERIEREERAARQVREEADAKAKAERELAEIEARRRQEEEAARQKAIRDEQEKAWAEKQAQEQAKRAAEEAEAARQAEAQAKESARLRAAQDALEAEKREVAHRQEEVLQTDRLIGVLRDRIKGEKRYAIIAKAIEAWYMPSSRSR